MDDKPREMSSEALEQELQRKGLNAPRLKPANIQEQIVKEDFYVFPGTTLTICCLTLRNGYNVIGEAACAASANFDAEIGRNLARDNATKKIWALEGYLLCSKLAKTI